LAESTISFERGKPSADSFPVEQIKECAATVLDADPDTLLQYGKWSGYVPLCETIAEWYGVTAEQVVVSNGSLQLLDFLATLFLHPGDTAFVEQPTYDRALSVFQRHGANVVGIPLQPDGLDVDFLAVQLPKTTAKLLYMIPDFQNPSGITTSLDKRKRVVHLAEEHGVWVIEDAPYRALRYKGSDVPTMRSINPQRVIHMSSFAKILSPGLRVGYIVAPSDVMESLASLVANTYISPGILAQGIAYEFCRRGWLQPNIERLKGIYQPKLEATLAALQENLPQADWFEPEGGYFVGLNLPATMNSANLRERAEKVGLGLSDGRGFFPRGGGERFIRLAFSALSVPEIHEGISRLAKLVSQD